MKKAAFTFLLLHSVAYVFAQNRADSTAVILPDEADLYFPMDRPSQTYNAKTAAKNTWILQMGVNWGSLIKTNQRQDYDVFSFPINLRYGITDKLEVMLSPSPEFGSTVGGGRGIKYNVSAWDLALRYSLFKDKAAGSLSLLGSYTYLNDVESIINQDQIILKLLYSLPIGRYISLGTNLGYSSIANNPDQFTYT